MPNLYIIAGCNGAGKTTASFTLLPEILDCREFVNADIINNMDSKEKELKALSEKVMHGLKIAMHKMVAAKAASNTDLVISDHHGNIKDVPAKDYLRTMK